MIQKSVMIAQSIADGINSGKYIPLGTIPSERALKEKYGVARETVRKALEQLCQQGVICRRPGRATIVSENVGGAKMKIGVMISGCMDTEIFRAVCDVVEKMAEAERVEVVFGDASRNDVDQSGSAAYAVAREMVDRGIRGVIFQPVLFSRTAEEINCKLVQIFRDAGVEVVLIDCEAERMPKRGEFDLVGIDNFNAGRMAAEHAIERGAKKIAFLARCGCADTVHRRWYGVRSVSDRVEVEGAYVKSFADHVQMRKDLSGMSSLDTIICQNDLAAMNVMIVLRKMGLDIPRDVMVIGFDDVVLAGKAKPGLTSVHQPCGEIAEQAFRRLLARMANPQLKPVCIQCREWLVARGSTDRTWK